MSHDHPPQMNQGETGLDFEAEMNKPMRELRCPKCHVLLAMEYVTKGRISIKCWKCKEMVRAVFRDYRNGKIKTGEQSSAQ